LSNTRLEALLKARLRAKKPSAAPPVYAGEYQLIDNEKLALQLLDEYADLTENFPSYNEFKKLFDHEPFKEKEPKQTDSRFNLSNQNLSPKERQLKQLYFYNKAKSTYDKRNRHYQKTQARARTFTQGSNASFCGFISCINNPSLATNNADYPQPLAEAESFFFTSTHKLHIDEGARKKHTYITAMTGHGKSVCMESILNHYLTDNTETAVVLLDPHGDLAVPCGRLSSNKDSGRLIYIKPSLDPSLTPTLNPFDIQSTDWQTINKASAALIEVFKDVMRADGDGAKFTPQMVTVLKPVIATLLHMKGSSFTDLVKFLDDDPSEYQTYLSYAKKVLTNPMQIEALNKDFLKESFNPTKLSIKTKVRNLLNDDFFFNFLVGKSTFDLKKALDDKAVIVFDLSDITDEAQTAIGRFVMATITNIARQRAKLHISQRIPIHLFVDECHNFVSLSMKKILTETRKYGLHGTFAQQFTGQGMDTSMRKAIIGNSAVKITGKNGFAEMKIMANEMSANVDDMDDLPVGTFLIKSETNPAIRVKMPMLTNKDRMTWDEWNATLEDQKRQYYRPITTVKNTKPQHTRSATNAGAGTHNQERKPAGLKDTPSGITPHLKPRGQNLDDDPFKKK